MGKLIDMNGNPIEGEPSFFRICIDFPSDKYKVEDVEGIAKQLHKILADSKVLHTEPEITNIYSTDEYEVNNA